MLGGVLGLLVYTCACMYQCMCVCVSVCVCASLSLYIYMYIYIDIHVYPYLFLDIPPPRSAPLLIQWLFLELALAASPNVSCRDKTVASDSLQCLVGTPQLYGSCPNQFRGY